MWDCKQVVWCLQCLFIYAFNFGWSHFTWKWQIRQWAWTFGRCIPTNVASSEGCFHAVSAALSVEVWTIGCSLVVFGPILKLCNVSVGLSNHSFFLDFLGERFILKGDFGIIWLSSTSPFLVPTSWFELPLSQKGNWCEDHGEVMSGLQICSKHLEPK